MVDNEICLQSPWFKSYGSGRYCLNPALRPNCDDSLCDMIDSGEILDLTYKVILAQWK